MDPNETLAKIRALVAKHNDADRRDASADLSERDVDDLVEHVQALDEWLSKGGYLPEAWASVVALTNLRARYGPLDPVAVRAAAQEQSDLAEEER